MKTYHLENISSQPDHSRHFLKPSEEDLERLEIGDLVRLFFVLDFKAKDNCRAERMWVEISEIDGAGFKGFLTNEPVHIKDLQIGEVVDFQKKHIATVILESDLDEKKLAVISLKALHAKEINWLVRDEPDNAQDSGWQLFFGDESEDYLSKPSNCVIIRLEEALQLEPRLEKAFLSTHDAFEWSEEAGDFVPVE